MNPADPMSQDEYRAALVALYGSERSNSKLAKTLDVSEHTTRAWAKGSNPVPAWAAKQIRWLMLVKNTWFC